MKSVPDRIVKEITLKAPLARVWAAISDAQAFGSWFGVDLDHAFAAGTLIKGRIRPTTVDPEVAKLQEPHTGKEFVITVDEIEPQRLFSFRWHPYAVDAAVDYSQEPTTLVAFELRPAGEHTHLTITESGFDKIPLARRADAFTANEGGWEHQSKLIEKYLARHG